MSAGEGFVKLVMVPLLSFGIHCLPVTDFSIAAMAMSASGKVPRDFSAASNASTPRRPRRIRNPAQAPPFMTETRRGVSVLAFTMCVSPKEAASPSGGAIHSLRSDRTREFATLLADRWHYGLIPNFRRADSPAEVRALCRCPTSPGRGHFLDGD